MKEREMISHVPGGSGLLVKGVLASTEGSVTTVEFDFNPSEVTIDKPVAWQKHKNVVGDSPTLEFTGAEPKTLACDLLFDMFEAHGDVYAAYISKPTSPASEPRRRRSAHGTTAARCSRPTTGTGPSAKPGPGPVRTRRSSPSAAVFCGQQRCRPRR